MAASASLGSPWPPSSRSLRTPTTPVASAKATTRLTSYTPTAGVLSARGSLGSLPGSLVVPAAQSHAPPASWKAAPAPERMASLGSVSTATYMSSTSCVLTSTPNLTPRNIVARSSLRGPPKGPDRLASSGSGTTAPYTPASSCRFAPLPGYVAVISPFHDLTGFQNQEKVEDSFSSTVVLCAPLDSPQAQPEEHHGARLPGSLASSQAMTFNRIDRNHDGFTPRDDWNSAGGATKVQTLESPMTPRPLTRSTAVPRASSAMTRRGALEARYVPPSPRPSNPQRRLPYTPRGNPDSRGKSVAGAGGATPARALATGSLSARSGTVAMAKATGAASLEGASATGVSVPVSLGTALGDLAPASERGSAAALDSARLAARRQLAPRMLEKTKSWSATQSAGMVRHVEKMEERVHKQSEKVDRTAKTLQDLSKAREELRDAMIERNARRARSCMASFEDRRDEQHSALVHRQVLKHAASAAHVFRHHSARRSLQADRSRRDFERSQATLERARSIDLVRREVWTDRAAVEDAKKATLDEHIALLGGEERLMKAKVEGLLQTMRDEAREQERLGVWDADALRCKQAELQQLL